MKIDQNTLKIQLKLYQKILPVVQLDETKLCNEAFPLCSICTKVINTVSSILRTKIHGKMWTKSYILQNLVNLPYLFLCQTSTENRCTNTIDDQILQMWQHYCQIWRQGGWDVIIPGSPDSLIAARYLRLVRDFLIITMGLAESQIKMYDPETLESCSL